MKKKNNIIKKVCLVIILLFSFVTSVDAADDKKHGIGFEIRPILPQTQIDNSLGYYFIFIFWLKSPTLFSFAFINSFFSSTISPTIDLAI